MLLWLPLVAAHADRFADTDYECEQANADPTSGFRCLVNRPPYPGTRALFIYETPIALTEAAAKQRNYRRSQIEKGFLASGGRESSRFWRTDGRLYTRACAVPAHKRASAGFWCWDKVAVDAQLAAEPDVAKLTRQ